MGNKKLIEYVPKTIGYSVAIFSFIIGIVALVTSLGILSLSKDAAIILIIYSIFLITTLILLDRAHSQNNFLSNRITEGTYGLITAYEEIGNYRLKEKYLQFFSQFSRYESQVIAIQAYNYHIISKRNNVDIKLTNEYGHVSENIDMNAIIQGYYTFNKRELKEIKNALLHLNVFLNPDPLLNYIIRQDKNFETLSQESVSLVNFAKNTLSEMFNINIPKYYAKKESKKSTKRLGLIMSIINFEVFNEASNFSFNYYGDNSTKKDRHYLSFIVESVTGEKRLFLIVYEIEPFKTNDDIISIGNDLALSFKKLLYANDLVNDTHVINYENKKGWMEDARKKFEKPV